MKLGDIIYYITKYTGIKYIVETFHALKGTKCNCDKRRKKLNAWTCKACLDMFNIDTTDDPKPLTNF